MTVSAEEGYTDGKTEGNSEGNTDGNSDEDAVGGVGNAVAVGRVVEVGNWDNVGLQVTVSAEEGNVDGNSDGSIDGRSDAAAVGAVVGVSVNCDT